MDINNLPTIGDLHDSEERIINQFKISNKTTTSNEWLRTKDVVQMLGLSNSGVQNLRIRGILKYSKVAGTIYYKREDINTLLESNKVDF